MKHILATIVSFLSFNVLLAQQAGSLDLSFNPSAEVVGSIYSTAIQPDGRIIIGGGFTNSFNGRNYIARINPDGTHDLNFTSVGTDNSVLTTVLQDDGKIMIGGRFTITGGAARGRIARLNANGTVDLTFNPGAGANSWVSGISPLPNGKMIICGWFTSYDGTPINRIARIENDGTLDFTFNPGSGANDRISKAIIQPDGRIIISGDFTTFNGVNMNRIARLNPDGSLDPTFNPGTGANRDVVAALQPDGKIVIGGDFTSFNGTPINRLARLNSDGSLDLTFDAGTGVNGNIATIVIQPDLRILIGGDFISYNGLPSRRIARVNGFGSLDNSFSPGTGANNFVSTINLQPDGRMVIGGDFTSYNGTSRPRIARLNVDGSLDVSLNPGTGANDEVHAAVLQPDGKILIGGSFTAFNGTPRGGIARLNTNGTLDASFNPGTGIEGLFKGIFAMALQSDGKILIGGSFWEYNGTPRENMARLNPNGTIDQSFNTGLGADSWISDILLQADGKIIISGWFTSFNGSTVNRIARLNADGSLDLTFNSGSGADDRVNDLHLQSDGKILIAGDFTNFNGISRNRIARLNADGSLDFAFNPPSGANSEVHAISQQGDGKVLVGGRFTMVNGVPTNGIARLNPNGSFDATLETGTGVDVTYEGVLSITPEADGKIILGGWFNDFNGIPRANIARLNPNGSLDLSFNPGTGASFFVNTTVLQPNGRILLGGDFTSYDGLPIEGIARVFGTSIIGLDDESIKSVHYPVFPNPAENIIHIKSPKGSYLALYDLHGRLLLQAQAEGEQSSFNIGALQPGTYLIEISSDEGTSRQKLLKQ